MSKDKIASENYFNRLLTRQVSLEAELAKAFKDSSGEETPLTKQIQFSLQEIQYKLKDSRDSAIRWTWIGTTLAAVVVILAAAPIIRNNERKKLARQREELSHEWEANHEDKESAKRMLMDAFDNYKLSETRMNEVNAMLAKAHANKAA